MLTLKLKDIPEQLNNVSDIFIRLNSKKDDTVSISHIRTHYTNKNDALVKFVDGKSKDVAKGLARAFGSRSPASIVNFRRKHQDEIPFDDEHRLRLQESLELKKMQVEFILRKKELFLVRELSRQRKIAESCGIVDACDQSEALGAECSSTQSYSW